MKLLLIRHGDPDYEKDSLTEKGFVEAELLSSRISKMQVDYFYTSPLGRARDTATPTLEKMGRTAQVLPWAQEFRGRCVRPDLKEEHSCWDFLPGDWTVEPLFYDKDNWYKAEVFKNTNVYEEYNHVAEELDKLLASHGYTRRDGYYSAQKPNHDTIVIFCHFAVGCVMLSHLLSISPMLLWHGMVAAPTSVTELCTEERREGKAYFRMSKYGDVSHLYAADEEAAFAARFCECFTDDTRH